MSKKWMQDAVSHPGYLHSALGVKQGEKIPAAKVENATHSDNLHLRKAAVLAQTFAHHRPNHPHAHHATKARHAHPASGK